MKKPRGGRHFPSQIGTNASRPTPQDTFTYAYEKGLARLCGLEGGEIGSFQRGEAEVAEDAVEGGQR